jgi:cytochrome c biogenesis protein CcdA
MTETKCRTTLVFFFVFLACGSCFASPKIFLPQGTEYNLGDLEEGKVYERKFFINNPGDSSLEVRALRVGCGCTTIIYPKQKVEVPPGKSIEAKFTFNTEGMQEGVIKYIYIESDDPIAPLIKVKLTAQVKKSGEAIKERFLSFGLFTVLGAGLIDGVNPCAFTVLVFFISFLNFVGYRKKELLVLGIVFILSVFFTYILIGIGLFKFIQSLEVFGLLSKIIYLAVAWLTIILGIYSIYDWYIYKKTGSPDEFKLKLPSFIKLKIQRIVQGASRNRNRTLVELAIAIFASGFVVSLLESVCTGQTYVPTIAYVLKTPSLRSKAFFYLALYNLMFILPLVIIFLAMLRGVTSEMFSKISRRHLGTIKLLTAALFFLLGVLLLFIKGGTR